LEDKILEKPSSEDHAREMLRRLSGSTHTVHTAVVLLLPKRQQQQHSTEPAALVRSFHESTQVTFADLSDEMINAYVATGSPMYYILPFSLQPRRRLTTTITITTVVAWAGTRRVRTGFRR
jgi:septum formation protein